MNLENYKISKELQKKYQNMINSDTDFYNKSNIIRLSNFIFFQPFSKKIYIHTLSEIMPQTSAVKTFNDLIKYEIFKLIENKKYFNTIGYIPEDLQKKIKSSIDFNLQTLKKLELESNSPFLNSF